MNIVLLLDVIVVTSVSFCSFGEPWIFENSVVALCDIRGYVYVWKAHFI